MGHLPLSQSEFSAWEPVLITRTTVTQDELEGYDEMKKHGLTFKHAWMDWEKRLSLPENSMKVTLFPKSS